MLEVNLNRDKTSLNASFSVYTNLFSPEIEGYAHHFHTLKCVIPIPNLGSFVNQMKNNYDHYGKCFNLKYSFRLLYVHVYCKVSVYKFCSWNSYLFYQFNNNLMRRQHIEKRKKNFKLLRTFIQNKCLLGIILSPGVL